MPNGVNVYSVHDSSKYFCVVTLYVCGSAIFAYIRKYVIHIDVMYESVNICALRDSID